MIRFAAPVVIVETWRGAGANRLGTLVTLAMSSIALLGTGVMGAPMARQYFADVQAMGGNSQDTNSLIRRLS